MILIYDVFHHSQLISWTIHPALSNLVGFLSNRESCVLFPSPFFATTEKFLFSKTNNVSVFNCYIII